MRHVFCSRCGAAYPLGTTRCAACGHVAKTPKNAKEK
jgi:ribosomal protein L37E